MIQYITNLTKTVNFLQFSLRVVADVRKYEMKDTTIKEALVQVYFIAVIFFSVVVRTV